MAVKPVPAVKDTQLPDAPSIAIAPISSSSGSDVVAVLPELTGVVVVPVACATLSTGDINPLTVKNVVAMLTLAHEATVIVPFEGAVVTGAENPTVLMPLVPAR